MRIAAIVHVYYPEFWPELAACLRNLGDGLDLFVTYGSESAVAAARRDFPNATFVACETRGYDVWPFLKVLQTLDLAAYDAIVKLHTKRDVDDGIDYRFNHCRYNGSAWRDYLLAFVRTPEAWARTVRRLRRPQVGLVADRHVILRRCDVPLERTRKSFDAAADFLQLTPAQAKRGEYVAGTMFAAKPAALRPLLFRAYRAEDFDAPCGHVTETFAHLLERALGLAVVKAGCRLAAFNGSLALRRALFPIRRKLEKLARHFR